MGQSTHNRWVRTMRKLYRKAFLHQKMSHNTSAQDLSIESKAIAGKNFSKRTIFRRRNLIVTNKREAYLLLVCVLGAKYDLSVSDMGMGALTAILSFLLGVCLQFVLDLLPLFTRIQCTICVWVVIWGAKGLRTLL